MMRKTKTCRNDYKYEAINKDFYDDKEELSYIYFS